MPQDADRGATTEMMQQAGVFHRFSTVARLSRSLGLSAGPFGLASGRARAQPSCVRKVMRVSRPGKTLRSDHKLAPTGGDLEMSASRGTDSLTDNLGGS